MEEKSNYPCENCPQQPIITRMICVICGTQPLRNFSDSIIRNRIYQKVICIDCSHPPCSVATCTTCKKCRYVHCKKRNECTSNIEAQHPKQMICSMENKINYRCENCPQQPRMTRAQETPMTCIICGSQPLRNLSDNIIRHRTLEALICIDCSHPPCSMATCTTCKQCRSVHCKRVNECTSSIEPLHPQQIMKRVQDKESYECDNCKTMSCRVCGSQPMKRFSESAIANAKKSRTENNWHRSQTSCMRRGILHHMQTMSIRGLQKRKRIHQQYSTIASKADDIQMARQIHVPM